MESITCALPTVWFTVFEVLVANEVLPLNVATTASAPAARLVVVTMATPLESDPVPSFLLPLLNATLPVTVPAVELTVAVRVTD